MAPLTALHWNVTGEVKPVAPLTGESGVAGLLLQRAVVDDDSVNVFEYVAVGQSPKSASTYQARLPCGTGTVMCVPPNLPRTNRSVPLVLAVTPHTT